MITWRMISDRWNREQIYPTSQYWDQEAEKTYSDSGILTWRNPHLNAILHKLEGDIVHGWLADVRGRQVLDVGCGAGRFARELAKRGATVTAVDFSPKSIDIAKRLSVGYNINYSVASIYDLDAVEVYDTIVCSKVLAVACVNRENVQDCLFRMRRALKPGGALISIEPLHTSFARRVLSMSPAQFLEELKLAGFEVTESRQVEFFPARMALAFFSFPKWFTHTVFALGDAALKVFPGLADQTLVSARKT